MPFEIKGEAFPRDFFDWLHWTKCDTKVDKLADNAGVTKRLICCFSYESLHRYAFG